MASIAAATEELPEEEVRDVCRSGRVLLVNRHRSYVCRPSPDGRRLILGGPVGATTLTIEVGGNSMRLAAPVRVPLFGGAMTVRSFESTELGLEMPRFEPRHRRGGGPRVLLGDRRLLRPHHVSAELPGREPRRPRGHPGAAGPPDG